MPTPGGSRARRCSSSSWWASSHSVDVAEHLRRAQGWMDGLGAWGPIAFIAIYVATTLVAGPGLPFTLVSPVLFGPWAGLRDHGGGEQPVGVQRLPHRAIPGPGRRRAPPRGQ